MSFGKMNSFIDLISNAPVKDADGFVINGDHIVASVRAYKEDRNGSERWANMAVFSEASVLFRFRKIPGVEVSPALFIVCEEKRYHITSAEDVRGRGMYVECLCELMEGSMN
ncbi:head-tail adaptor protein [Caproicibacter sp. BJN0012]|uniref:head-tail adaptor protein n=1 Tax=Caproicibacter sp. BJN0012 TaxID=3110227 RepID=UPI002E0E4D19